jgi:hypothetical protein
MKGPAWLVVACVLGGGCVHDALLSITPGVDEFPGTPAKVARESHLGQEIEAGYRTYGVVLAPLGQWSTDPTYGVHWCPKITGPVPFVPYLSKGHWAPVESVTTPHGELPPEAPYWVPDPDAARGDVTMHHGWWVGDERPGAEGHWCWVPGVEETAARVVWRESDGFVAWAPEPPPNDQGDEDDDDLLAWVYEFVGTLFDDSLEPNVLRGDAADLADGLTRQARSGDRIAGRPPSRVGPTRSAVSTARSALSQYVLAHPVVGNDGSGPASAAPHDPHAGPSKLPEATTLFKQMAHDSTLAEWSPGRPLPTVSRDAVHSSSGERGGRGSSFNSYAGHAGGGDGCNCASHSGGRTSGTSESHASSSSHSSSSGHTGASGGDCGTHSSPHTR